MYISCSEGAIAAEAELGYVPNNPLFGLPLDGSQVNVRVFATALSQDANQIVITRSSRKRKKTTYYKDIQKIETGMFVKL